MFTLEEAKQDPNFYNDLRAEVALEVEKCGPIEKLTVFEVGDSLSSLFLFCA